MDTAAQIAALHLDADRLISSNHQHRCTRADVAEALQFADLAMEFAQEDNLQAEVVDRCGRLQALCYDLLFTAYSPTGEFERTTYARKAWGRRQHASEARDPGSVAECSRSESRAKNPSSPLSSSPPSVMSSSTSSPASRRMVRFLDQVEPLGEAPALIRDTDGALADGQVTPMLRKRRGQNFDEWKCVV
ncbi:hypothetical protein DL764_001879 [Monosporascus ibericus]|uniref:Uncharacterized protein n=1 Tax=Monosporascus ibericus TaxID=155417 RepID=A0A4Q4TMR7_9PEZI|nr:hypothetical protein DL764_001879 [Monosporascus ibericus]